MEDLTNVTKVVSGIWDQFKGAPSHMLFLIVCLAIGMMIKKSPLPNWMIPIILVSLGVFVYPLIASPGNIDPSFREGSEIYILRIYGGLIGFASIAAHAFMHWKFKWYQSLEYAVVNAFRAEDDKEETRMIKNPNPPDAQPPV